MSRSDEQRLDDMREMCARIERLVGRGRIAFDEDDALQPAIERSLEVLGEAANAVSPERRADFPSIQWSEVTRLRIVLAHHYHRVGAGELWTIASTDIPVVTRALGPLVDDGSG